MSCLSSKPKYNIGDIVEFNLKSTYTDVNGREGEVNQKVNGEIVGIQCDVQCVSNNMNNWQYYIHRSGMTHFRDEYQISGFMRELNK
jgi:hypothetical protein